MFTTTHERFLTVLYEKQLFKTCFDSPGGSDRIKCEVNARTCEVMSCAVALFKGKTMVKRPKIFNVDAMPCKRTSSQIPPDGGNALPSDRRLRNKRF